MEDETPRRVELQKISCHDKLCSILVPINKHYSGTRRTKDFF